MNPKRLSASAIDLFEKCEANYAARQIERVPEVNTRAALRGTVVHGALEQFVAEGHYKNTDNLKVLESFCRDEYARWFSDDGELKACLDFCRTWYARQDWSGREVLSTEATEHFDLPFHMPDGTHTIQVAYIWDRCDRLADGSIEVVDYKTVSQPVSPEEMRTRIQPRLYALAAQLKYKDATRIWVTYDLLRYEQVGVVFTKEENRATYKYLQDVARRIHESEGKVETLNDGCRWCVRKATCETLQSNVAAGGIMSVDSPSAAADLRMKMDAQKGAATNLIAELDEYILDYMEREDMVNLTTDNAEVRVVASGRRVVDSQRVAGVVGPEIASRYGKLSMENVKEILAQEDLTESQKSEINQAIRKQFGDARVKVAPLMSDIE